MNKKDICSYLFFTFLLAIAFFLRLYRLDERVFHHDEAAVGYFTYRLFKEGVYSYNPSFHGPFIYYVTTGIFRLLGDSIYTARLLPALLGAAMILFLIPLRRYIGNTGMVIAAFFFALSPSFLYYSRFYREDIFISFFTLMMLVCAVKYIDGYNKDRYSAMRLFYLFIAGIALASMAALKENAYITMALIILFLFLLFLREKSYTGLIERIRRLDEKVLILVLEALFLVLIVLIVFSLFYTGKFTDIYGIKDAFIKAVSHWTEMHKVERIGGPYYFYLPILSLYELPILVFGIAGIIYYGIPGRKKEIYLILLLLYWIIADLMYYLAQIYPPSTRFLPVTYIQASVIIFFPLIIFAMIIVLRSQNLFFSFLSFWALTNFAIYSYLQEKVPWLVLNPLLPLVLIGAGYLNEILPNLKINSKVGTVAILFLIAGSCYLVYSSILLNFYNYTNPAEPMIQAAQPPQKYSLFINKIFEISSQYQNRSTEIEVTDAEIETQFLWYLRHYPNVRWKVSIDSELNAPLIVVHDSDDRHEPDIVKRRMRTDYERLDSAKMSWYWFSPSDITIDYLLYRKMDRQPSEYRIVLFYQQKT